MMPACVIHRGLNDQKMALASPYIEKYGWKIILEYGVFLARVMWKTQKVLQKPYVYLRACLFMLSCFGFKRRVRLASVFNVCLRERG